MKASRLSFKGDSKPYRRKKNKTVVDALPESSVQNGWIKAKSIISGPCVIISSTLTGNVALAVDPQFKLYWSPLQKESIEPTQANQVFVLKTVLDSKYVLLKSCFDRHLGTDSKGIVECDKEAAGMNHQWEIIKIDDDKFTLKSYFGTFLAIQTKSDEDGTKKTKVVTDENESVNSEFYISIQASSLMSTMAKKEVDWVEVESEKLKTAHGHSLGKVKLYKEFGSGLSDAVKKGNINETLLERRSKMKRDKFCW